MSSLYTAKDTSLRRSDRERKQINYSPKFIIKLPLPRFFLQSLDVGDIKVSALSEAEQTSLSYNSNKRSAKEVIDVADSASSTLSSSLARQDPAPKRQCLEASVPKLRLPLKTKVSVELEDDNRPEPRGQPEVWAEVYSTIPALLHAQLTYL